MSIQPKGDSIRHAVKWISEKLKEPGDHHIVRWIEQASVQFNLSPKEEGDLLHFFKDSPPSN